MTLLLGTFLVQCVGGYFIKAVNLPRFWYYWAHFIDYQVSGLFPLSERPFEHKVMSMVGGGGRTLIQRLSRRTKAKHHQTETVISYHYHLRNQG